MGLILHKMTTLIPSAPLRSHGSTCQFQDFNRYKSQDKKSQNWTTWRSKDCQRSAKSLVKDPKIRQSLQPHHCSLLWIAYIKFANLGHLFFIRNLWDKKCHQDWPHLRVIEELAEMKPATNIRSIAVFIWKCLQNYNLSPFSSLRGVLQ